MPDAAWNALFPQLAVFPLHPIDDGRCGCGNPGCMDAGKHPDGPWGDIEPAEKRRSRHHPRAGYGIATGQRSGVFVVDADGVEGLANLRALGPLPDTFTVRRGHGRHFYFKATGRTPTTRSELAPKVDTRGDGGYIVAPGSPHKSGDTYVVERDVPLADVPDWLAEWIANFGASDTPQVYEGDVEGADLYYHAGEYEEYLRTCPPCVQYQGGDGQLWRVVQYGAYDLALPGDVVLDMIREFYDPRCQPPWGDELERKVTHKIKCAKEHSTRPPNMPIPRDLLTVDVTDPEEDIEAAATPVTDDAELTTFEQELKMSWGDWSVEVPPPRYIVKDVIPHDTVGMIVAKGSSLKTWMALSIALAVANGDPWLGQFAVDRGAVLIVDFESGQWQLRHRARQLGAGNTPNLGHANFPTGRIDDPKFWVKLAKVCKARAVRLVLIDSFAAGAAGVDENTALAALPLTLAARFTDAVGASVVFIHHAKKGEGGDERDLVRGTGAIYAACDWAVTMIPLDENRTKMRVRNIKPWGPRPEDFAIELTADGTLVLSADATEPMENIEAEVLAVLAGGPIANIDLIAKTLKRRKADVSPYVKALETKGKVANLRRVGYALDDDQKRKERVKLALDGVPCKSFGELAKRACVESSFLDAMYNKGEIVLSGSQYMWPGQ